MPRHVASITQSFTGFTTQYVQIKDDETLGQVYDQVPISHPTPEFDITQFTVANPRPSSDNLTLVADITVAGSIDDPSADLIEGPQGVIDQYELLLNGEPLNIYAAGQAPPDPDNPDPFVLQVNAFSKTADPNSVLKPFDFSAQFQTTLEGVEIQPGLNHLELVAANHYGFTGAADATFEIEADYPDLRFEIDFQGQEPYPEPFQPQTILVSVWEDEVLIADGVAFESDKPGIYRGPVLGGFMEIITPNRATDPTLPDYLVVTATSDQHNMLMQEIGLIETDDDSLVFEGDRPPPSDWGGYEMALTSLSELIGAPGNSFAPMALELAGPTELEDVISEARLTFDEQQVEYSVKRAEDLSNRLLYVTLGSGNARPRAFLAIDQSAPFDPGAEPLSALGERRTGFDQYLLGVAAGVGDAGVALYDGATTVARGAAYIVKNYNPAVYNYRRMTGNMTTYVSDARAVHSTVQLASDAVQVAGEVVWNLIQDNIDLQVALLTRDHDRINELGEEYSFYLEIAAEILDAVEDYLHELDDYQVGRLVGRVLGEIAIEVAAAVASGGVAAVAKASISVSVIGKLRSARYLQDAPGLLLALDRVIDKLEFVRESPICFTKGTPVATTNGLRPIETIRPGDLVLAWNPTTGVQDYKPVVQTFVTHPKSLLRLTVAAAADDSAPETITCTPQHPFYVAELDRFVPAAELEIGDRLLLAAGPTAPITDIQVQRGPPAGGGVFTTYNFEVADWHTYFVGASQILVHNRGTACQRAAALVWTLRHDEGLDHWENFTETLRLTNTAQGKKAIDPAMVELTEALMDAMYKDAAPSVSGTDLSKLRTVAEIDAYRGTDVTRPGYRIRNKGLELHHTFPEHLVNEIAEQALGRELTRPELDGMPGLLWHETLHRDTGDLDDVDSLATFHRRLRDALDGQDLNRANILSALRMVYQDMGMPEVANAAEKWLIDNGL